MRKVVLRRERVEGERGEDGVEERLKKNLGLFFAVLHWSLGLSGGVGRVAVVVRQRRVVGLGAG